MQNRGKTGRKKGENRGKTGGKQGENGAEGKNCIKKGGRRRGSNTRLDFLKSVSTFFF
jgi:hypothetical protein